jgi:Fe-S-cluster containining protein
MTTPADKATRITDAYRHLLTSLDEWFAAAQEEHPGVIPCTGGCSRCCHGPFDISVADALLVREAVRRQPAERRAELEARAADALQRQLAIADEWSAPYDARVLGDDAFDALGDELADEPCPMLDADGRCAIYEDRPLVCRLIGLPLRTAEGEMMDNACPIIEEHPAYAALAPRLFDLVGFEQREAPLRVAAGKVLGVDEGFETTVAGAVGRG